MPEYGGDIDAFGKGKGKDSGPRPTLECYGWHGTGHSQRVCPTPPGMSDRPGAEVCTNCKGKGHGAAQCSSKGGGKYSVPSKGKGKDGGKGYGKPGFGGGGKGYGKGYGGKGGFGKGKGKKDFRHR